MNVWVTHLYRPTRGGLFVLLFLLAIASAAPAHLALASLVPFPAGEILTLIEGPYRYVVERTMVQIGLVILVSLPVGMLLGLSVAVGHSFFRKSVTLLLFVPLMLPPFVWAIGWSTLRRFFTYRHQVWFDGLPGCLLASSTICIPFVAFATMLSIQGCSKTHINVLHLAGGFLCRFRNLARFTMLPALSAAVLSALFTSADPGAAQIMGFHGVASSVFIDFSARNDIPAAALKCGTFVILVLPFIVFSSHVLAGRVNAWISGANLPRTPVHLRKREAWICGGLGLGLSLALILPPLGGIVWPILKGDTRKTTNLAITALTQSLPATLFYSCVTGLFAAGIGVILAMLASPSRFRRQVLLVFACLGLAVPPSINAFALVALGSKLPSQLDLLFRGNWVVGMGQGLRLVPLAAAICLYTWNQIPASSHYAAATHGLSMAEYIGKVGLPRIFSTLMNCALIAGVLGLADVPSTILLAPPGSTSFPGRLFGVMDNASEVLVASLTTIYLLLGVFTTGIAFLVVGRWRRSYWRR